MAFSRNLIKPSNITRKYDIGLVAKLSVLRDFVTYVPDVPTHLTYLMCLTCLHLLCALRVSIFHVLYVPSFFLKPSLFLRAFIFIRAFIHFSCFLLSYMPSYFGNKNKKIDCGANQWTSFYIITASVMKGLSVSNFWNIFEDFLYFCFQSMKAYKKGENMKIK